MCAPSGDARGGVGNDLAEAFRDNETALVDGIGIVVERHEAILLDDGLGPCYSVPRDWALSSAEHQDVGLTTL